MSLLYNMICVMSIVYLKFNEILRSFIEFYNLEEYNIKQIDKYLWQLGKEYFKKKY